ncbi:MAG: helix-turn-helix domain-containing protein [Ruminococcaceae bacterium]|nr:helix-turn-helix domain-containing protein [Oscillospiraceae bacterium]
MQKRAYQQLSYYNTYFSPLPAEQNEPVYFSGIYTKLPYADDFTFLHYHDRYEIGICESGEGLFLSEGVFSSVSKGDLIFIAPSRRHYSRSLSRENPCVCRFAYLHASTVEQLISLSSSEDKKKLITSCAQSIPSVIHPTEDPKSAELLARIMEACAKKTHEGDMVAALLISAFMIESCEVYPPFSPPHIMSNTNDAISQISEYLYLHYSGSDTSKFLAQKCHLSESQLRRRFVSVYGMPPIAYRNLLRCRIAAELLTRTDMPVSEISGRIGFHTTSDFYRSFTKIYGTSPSHYRSSHR